MLIEMYNRIFRRKDIEMQEEKFKMLKEAETDFRNRYYINRAIENAYFSFEGSKSNDALSLINKRSLEGRDKEVTTFLTPLFKEANLVRGKVELWTTEEYPHDWIEVNIDGLRYCFDPCFNGLCLKCDYNKIFKPKEIAKIPAEVIRKELITKLTEAPNGTIIYGKDDITSPFYNIYAHAQGEIKDDKIKNLKLKFYEK